MALIIQMKLIILNLFQQILRDQCTLVIVGEQFMEMSIKDLLRFSQYASDGKERKIRFVDADPKAVKRAFVETPSKEINFFDIIHIY